MSTNVDRETCEGDGYTRGAVERGTGVSRLLESGLGLIAAVLLCCEIIVVACGVSSRYVLGSPLTWVDELGSILLMWLTMSGACVAYLRAQHMRVTAVVDLLPERLREPVRALATATAAVFLIAMILPSLDHLKAQREIELPGLGIDDGYRVAGLVVGIVVLAALAVSDVVRRWSWKITASSLIVLIVVAAAMRMSYPVLLAIGNYNLLVFFVVLLAACVAAAVPIAFSFGTVALSYVALMTKAPLAVIVGRIDEGVSHVALLSIPLFIFLGLLIEITGIARAIVRLLASLMGHVRGGLSYSLIGAMYLVSGISGSKTADMAAVAPGLLPEMEKRGSDAGEMTALLAATGAQTETVPPSLILIILASVTGMSVSALFTAGLIPAAICGLSLVLVVHLRARTQDRELPSRESFAGIMRAAFYAVPALLLPVLIRTSVTEGVATATEVATIGIAYAFVVGRVCYGRFDLRRIYPALVTTAALTGAILIILGCASAMAWGLTQSGFSRQIVRSMASIPGGWVSFTLLSIAAFAILGSVLEGLPAILAFGPLLFPVARALGMHDVHYAMIAIVSMGIGLFAPPFGVGYYSACAICGVRPERAMRQIWLYLAAIFLALLVIAFVPWLSVGLL